MPRTGAEPAIARSRGFRAPAVVLRRDEQGPAVAVEFVTERDLVDPRAELWFEAFPRRGDLGTPFRAWLEGCESAQEATPRASPQLIHRTLDDGQRICLGYSLECTGAGNERVRCIYPRSSLEHVATRASRRLVASGKLPEDATTFYSLTDSVPEDVQPEPRRRRAAGDLVVVRSSTSEPAPLSIRPTPIAPLLEAAEGHPGVDLTLGADDDYRVFFTREALERAERAARQGATMTPPRETGGLLVGSLCSCPETGELFAVVEDVLEAKHSEATTYSLEFSDRTWTRFHSILRAKQAHPETRYQRFLGQVHGHNFLPMQGAEPCEECAVREVCTRSTAFLSPDDLGWCRAVFHAEPWQLSQVFGLNARGEGVSAFYGQRGGRLVPRGHHVIDRFPVQD